MPDFDRPAHSEYAPFYRTYVDPLPDSDVVAQLRQQREEVAGFLTGLTPEEETFRYAPDKWTAREVVGHVVDAERVFALRALWFARGDQEPQPGFDENAWATRSNAAERPMADLVAEFTALRTANVAMLEGLDPGAGARTGTASGRPVSVRALVWIMAGHARHHLELLRTRYFPT